MVYVFHQDLLLHWSILQKEMPGIWERSFLKSLELLSKHKGRVSMPRVLLSSCCSCFIFSTSSCYLCHKKCNLTLNILFIFQVPVINSATFGTSFKEWEFCQYELDRLRKINWMACPACEDCQHSVHVDGNMKLYRFTSAGKYVSLLF